MNQFNGRDTFFSRESLSAAGQVWSRAAIALVDIRHNLIAGQDAVHGYRFPAHTFLYTGGGKAEVTLNNTSYDVERFGLFHGGRGSVLTIRPRCDWLEYYMVMYKAGEPPFHKAEYLRLMEEMNPFRMQYGFAPHNPAFFSEELRRMYERWRTPAALTGLYEKTAFYRFVYQIYEEMEQGNIHVLEPDIIAMARRYLDENYHEAVSIQDICSVFGISYSHFHRSFRQQVGKSPQEYLIHTRLSAALELLERGGVSIREVAGYCGFQDERNFQRLFARHMGVSPHTYRENTPRRMRGDTIGNIALFPYNEEDRVSVDELKGKGAISMFKQMKSKTVIAAALSLMLLLSACSTAPVNNGGADPLATSAVASDAPETKAADATKIISTVMGDVEVPANPQRIIVQYLMGDLVALQVTPVGITEVHDGAAFEGALRDAVYLSQWAFEPEDVMALEPDLILLASDTQYEDMSKIAPTVVVPYGSMTMGERMTFLGGVLNRTDEAKAALAEYEAAVSAGKIKLDEAGLYDATVSAMQVTGETNSVVGDMHSLGTIMYQELGLKAPEAVQKDIIDAGQYWGAPSMEVLANYCGDYVFHLGEVSEDIANNAVWQSIPAVSQGHVMVMNTALTYYSDISSSIAMLNNVVEQLVNTQKQS